MHLRFLLPIVALFAVLSLLPVTARQQDDENQPGFRLTLANGTAKDTTIARLVALYVPAGTRPSPFVPAGAFRATWQGDLQFELPEELTFSAEGRGKLLVKLKNQVLLDLSGEDFSKTPGKKIEVPGEPTPLTVEYEAPATGDATLRLSWKGENFVREPVAFTFARHAATQEEQTGAKIREGRALTAHLHCVKCHALKDTAMPEFASDAPRLAKVGGRVNERWLAHWIQNPHALRPQAAMPQLLAASTNGPGPEARDLAAYLVTLGAGPEREEPAAEEAVNQGARLFAHLGCVACHLMPSKEELTDTDFDRLPLRYVAAKWKPAALRAFLREPTAHYQWIRMPNFGLSVAEANHLAAFLLKTSQTKVSDAPYAKGDAARGKELLASKGCLSCHAVGDDKKLSPVIAPTLAELKKLDAGCLGAEVKAGGKAPAYALSPPQREALRAVLADGSTLLRHDSPIDLAERTMVRLRCAACHQRDGREDAWSRLRDESDSLLFQFPGNDPEKDPIGQPYPAVQQRPPLTWTGEKLRPEWLTAFLTGKIAYKPRPYLRARMPHFTGPMDQVATGLVLQHGRPPKSPPQPPVDAKSAAVGRELCARKNWGCVACHNVGKSVAEAAFEAPGINFQYVRDRLTRDYYERWVYSPLRVEPGTKMPAVFQPGKKSLLDQFFDGDSEKQVEAIWQYLRQGDTIQYPPE